MKTIFISPKKFKNLPKNGRWKAVLNFFMVLALFSFLFVAGVSLYFWKDLPSPGKVNARFVVESTKIYDRTGKNILYEIHGEEKRTLIPVQEIPDTVKYATIALEDQDFYSHHGIKFTSIARAVLKDISKRKAVQGGSTITQQFVKNSVLGSEKTLTRKIKEVIISLEMEQKFSKDEILGMYLNEIPYGSNAYGIEAAAKTFFEKSAKELTLDEAALLASLPQAPSRYSPYGSYPERLKARQEYALQQMEKLGYISQEDVQKFSEVDVLSKIATKKENINAPHFVMYVREYLETKYGGEQEISRGGLKVYTTLDWEKQQIAERLLREGVEKNAKNWNAHNASLVAIDPKTGQILAMAGSKDYFAKSQPEGCIAGKTCKFEGQINVAIRDRQPGSSFKPYVYLAAFSMGYTPETILYDVETEFLTKDGKSYKPQNYDGKFRGPLKIKETLPMSLNIPAVKMLYLVGVNGAVEMAKKLGITTLNNSNRFDLSLVLGGGEVKLLDHVNAFGTLANNGVKQQKIAVLRVENSRGEILEEFSQTEGERVVDEKYVAMLSNILSINEYRAPVFGENNPLRFEDRQVAVKTGTTNEFRDGWIVGYSPSISVGVWAGNNDNSPMRAGADGSNVAAPIWRAFLDEVFSNSNYNREKFSKYEKEEMGKDVLDGKINIKDDVKVCKIPDKDDEYCLANEYCPKKEIKERNFADTHTILWYVKKDDPRGDAPEKPQEDPQFKNWEKAIQKWYEKEKNKDYIVGKPPEKKCDKDDFAKFFPSVSLSYSYDGAVLKFSASVNAPFGAEKVDFFVENDKIYSGSEQSASYTVPDEFKGSSKKIKVELTDKNGNKATDSKEASL